MELQVLQVSNRLAKNLILHWAPLGTSVLRGMKRELQELIINELARKWVATPLVGPGPYCGLRGQFSSKN